MEVEGKSYYYALSSELANSEEGSQETPGVLGPHFENYCNRQTPYNIIKENTKQVVEN